MDADGSVYWIGASARAGIGRDLCGFRALERSHLRGHHTLHGAPRPSPLSVTRRGGQGVRPTRGPADFLLQRSTRARNAPRSQGGNAVNNNYSIPTRPDALISQPDPSASICVICGVCVPDSSETFATPGRIAIQQARCPTTRLPRRARSLPPKGGRPPRKDAFRRHDLRRTIAAQGPTSIPLDRPPNATALPHRSGEGGPCG